MTTLKDQLKEFMNLERIRAAPPAVQISMRWAFIAGLTRGSAAAFQQTEETVDAYCMEMNQLSLSNIRNPEIRAEAEAMVAKIEAMVEGRGATKQ